MQANPAFESDWPKSRPAGCFFSLEQGVEAVFAEARDLCLAPACGRVRVQVAERPAAVRALHEAIVIANELKLSSILGEHAIGVADGLFHGTYPLSCPWQ